jgi:hypothetical protein
MGSDFGDFDGGFNGIWGCFRLRGGYFWRFLRIWGVFEALFNFFVLFFPPQTQFFFPHKMQTYIPTLTFQPMNPSILPMKPPIF